MNVTVGEVLELKRRRVEVQPTETYGEIGIRSFGRGIFHKPPIAGSELGNKRVFKIEPGDLVLSNVFAWEGAVAMASNDESGRIGSHRFLTYVPRENDISVSYLRYFFISEVGRNLLGAASPGSAGRNRTLAIDRFESLELPLPTLAEQRRIATIVDDAFGYTREIRKRVEKRGVLVTKLIERSIDAVIAMSGAPERPIGEVTVVNPAPERLPADAAVTFVPMAAVAEQTGTIARGEVRMLRDLTSSYKQFRRGDVIFARITPCMQNGKTAVASELVTTHAYGSTEFHVLRPSDDISADWLHRVLRTRSFRRRAAERFTGTAGQQRVPADFIRETKIPLPDPATQAALVEQIDQIAADGLRADALQRTQTELAAVLDASILNAAFGGRL